MPPTTANAVKAAGASASDSDSDSIRKQRRKTAPGSPAMAAVRTKLHAVTSFLDATHITSALRFGGGAAQKLAIGESAMGAAALVTHRWRRAAGWALAAYALCVWPANAHHAIIDLSRGTGLPIWYHAPRLALQPAIIWWALWASGAVRVSRRAPR